MSVLIFISHKESEKKIAESLVDFLKSSLEINDNEIRCTSVAGYQLKFEGTIPDQLKRDIRSSKVIIALLTEESLESKWIMFEIGASWALGKKVVPILGMGLNHENLPGPLGSRPGIFIGEPDSSIRMKDAIKEIAKSIQKQEKTGGGPEDKLKKFITQFRRKKSNAPSVTKNQSSNHPASMEVSYEKLSSTTKNLHRYSLSASVTLNVKPDQDFYRVCILWPPKIRIAHMQKFYEGDVRVIDGISYKELWLDIKHRIYPKQTIKSIGSNSKWGKLEYEVDNMTLKKELPDLHYEIYLQDHDPVKGEKKFKDLIEL
jgi:hypothetical protein